MKPIQRVAVIGAGTMGSGIASHLANAGISVLLLDVVPSGSTDRNQITEQSLERIRKSRPPALMTPEVIEQIEIGNLEDDLHRISEVDWIAEAIVERLDAKHQLYVEIEEHRRPGTIVSSNTSTIPLRDLTQEMPPELQRDFCITHFFNPVRYMRLLEIVAGPATDPEVIKRLTACCDLQLGKGVVHCKDTPGFLGNRVGLFAIQCAIATAVRMELAPEVADAVMGRPMGMPKTGVFRLYDLIGLDLMLDVLESLRNTLAADDAFHPWIDCPAVESLVEQGHTGDKRGAGFYRTRQTTDGRKAEVFDLQRQEYRPLIRPQLPAMAAGGAGGLRALVERDDPAGQFAWEVLSRTLVYAASLVPDVADELVSIDEAMKLGFSWTHGPFGMIDLLGTQWFCERIEQDGLVVPPLLQVAAGQPMYRANRGRLQQMTIDGSYRDVERPAGVIRLGDVAKTTEAIITNDAATLWDLGDGVACFEFHTKANSLDSRTMSLLDQALSIVETRFRGLVVYNEGPHFSVGVNLQCVLDWAEQRAWSEIEAMLSDFQQTCKRMKYSSFPVVGAPAGMSIGGGFEVLLHCDVLQAHANTVVGLVETKVGLIPAGGGCKELLLRWSEVEGDEGIPPQQRVFDLIAAGVTASSPLEAMPLKMFRALDQFTMNRDRVLAAAKTRVISMIDGYQPPVQKRLVPTHIGPLIQRCEELRDAKQISPHDLTVGHALAKILCDSAVDKESYLTEDELFEREREAFLGLVQTPQTIARIRHMLATGRPLKN
ncbi:MAG: 3-hydroxyacyl-CoA dehydrogenase NAD-binding domain-containing protein [Pirellulaceae bacterium]|nr:3-hydroxyacyl-CoA dehydrogenase NAD-binding domain-containing protein [Pirellulaceae bacterium]